MKVKKLKLLCAEDAQSLNGAIIIIGNTTDMIKIALHNVVIGTGFSIEEACRAAIEQLQQPQDH